MAALKTSKPGGRARNASPAPKSPAKRAKKSKGAARPPRKGKSKGKKKGGKPCDCKKNTSKKNRDAVNRTKDGKKVRCKICKRTAAEAAAKKIRDKNYTGARAARWRKRRLESDHKYPSSKIKKDPGFKKLETKDLDVARKMMHLQSNMRPLCKPCNGSLQDKSGFQGTKIKERIKRELEKII